MPTKEEVFTGVREALVEALAVDEEEVTMEATLVDDLGAESIDLLDIVFRLEKIFSIKIDRSELIPEDLLSDARYVVDGKLTANGLEELKKRMPDKDFGDFEKNPMVQNISKILTVADMCVLVENKI
ncbi:MAG: acyl carrier protein [Planctomycetaceae bacterium]|nr:acyl carrier protein [Planctomycetaceae bacterium]